MQIQCTNSELRIIKKILADHLPGTAVYAFGSRTKNTAKPFSDLDLVIHHPQKISTSLISELKHAFSNSDLPFRIDIEDWHLLSQNFRQTIQKDLTRIH